MSRRTEYDAMEPKAHTTWLVVRDQYNLVRSVRELPPRADPKVTMVEALHRSVQKGWSLDCLPGSQALYFCRKGDRRHQVTISQRDPNDRDWVKRS